MEATASNMVRLLAASRCRALLSTRRNERVLGRQCRTRSSRTGLPRCRRFRSSNWRTFTREGVSRNTIRVVDTGSLPCLPTPQTKKDSCFRHRDGSMGACAMSVDVCDEGVTSKSMAASPPEPPESTASTTDVEDNTWRFSHSDETAEQYLSRVQQMTDAAAAEVDVMRDLVRLLQCRVRRRPVPPQNPPGLTAFQEFIFCEARDAQSPSEIQSLLTQAKTDLTAAIEHWNRARKTVDLTIEERRLTEYQSKLQEHARSRMIMASIADESRDANAAGLLSESGGSILEPVAATLRAAYGASTNEQLPCAVCRFKNGDNHAAAMPIDGVTPTVSRARILPRAVCEACGIPYDATNLIPLCGRLGWKGTCRHLFDSNRLAFVFKRQAGGWKCCAGNDHSALRGIVQFPNHPNPRGMHARAIRCARNVMFTACDLADMLPPDDSMPESSSGAALGGDGRDSRAAAPPRRDGSGAGATRLCAAQLAWIPFAPPMAMGWAELDLSNVLVPTGPGPPDVPSKQRAQIQPKSRWWCPLTPRCIRPRWRTGWRSKGFIGTRSSRFCS